MKLLKGHLLAFLTITICSSTFIVSKILLQQLEPLQILIFRYFICVIFLSIIYPKFSLPKNLKEEFFIIASAVCIAVYFVFENSSLKYTYASNVSLIVATIPIITVIFSSFLKKKRIATKSIIGFIIAYTGVILIILNGNSLKGVDPKGDLLALGAAISFSLYSIFLDYIHNKYHIIQLTRKVFIYSLLVLLLISLITKQSLIVNNLSLNTYLSLFYLGICASSLAFIMWNLAIKSIGSVKTNQYIYFVPVVTTIISAIVLKEKVTAIFIIGALSIIGGVYLSDNEISFKKSKIK